jgi:phosphoglycolate phosphatase-like HAD superfamily hydrolase
MEKRVLFDFDGTLANSMNEIFTAVSHVFISQGLEVPSFEDYIINFRFPFGFFYRARGVKLSDDEIFAIYASAYFKYFGLYNPPLYDDGLRLIHYLHKTNHTSSVITANSKDNTLRVLESAKLIHLVDCVSASNKEEAIRELVYRSSLGSKTPYVGDIIADMIDAKRAGAYPVAVLRNGLFKLANEFHKAGARMCIPSLMHLTKVVR